MSVTCSFLRQGSNYTSLRVMQCYKPSHFPAEPQITPSPRPAHVTEPLQNAGDTKQCIVYALMIQCQNHLDRALFLVWHDRLVVENSACSLGLSSYNPISYSLMVNSQSATGLLSELATYSFSSSPDNREYMRPRRLFLLALSFSKKRPSQHFCLV